MTRATTVQAAIALAFGVALVLPPVHAEQDAWPVGLANYRDVAELNARLAELAEDAHAQLFTIGTSIDYHTNPDRPTAYPIYAIRISASTDERVEDDVEKNSILFEAGSHPREWLSTEGALALAEHLVANAEIVRSGVPGILQGADVWIIPLTTVAGRVIDDTEGGDPRSFSTEPEGAGWRGNGDSRACDRGVNVARNFSSGWTSARSIDCVDDPEGSAQDPRDGKNNDPPSNYRGYAPFSTLEAAALRQFVQNHGISMAVVMHSNAQEIWNLWGEDDAAGTVIANRAMAAFNGRLIGQTYPLAVASGLGSGQGQFAAWLAQDSDTAGEPDNGTARRIQTIFVELPITDYPNSARYENGDGSNGFHPSDGQTMRSLRTAVVEIGRRLIGDARSPGCYIAPADAPPELQGGCPEHDFGFVGAKIARGGRSGRGSITTNVAGCLDGETELGCSGHLVRARDFVNAGSYTVYYRVQNFSRDAANDDVDVRLTFQSVSHLADGDIAAAPTTTRRSHTLATQEAEWGWFLVDLSAPNTDYTITLDIRPRVGSSDDFASNNRKVFKVTTPPNR
jgi:hypothetical protein